MNHSQADIEKLRSYAKTRDRLGPLDCWTVAPPKIQPALQLIFLMHGYGAPQDDLVGLAGPLLLACFAQGVNPVLIFPGAPCDLSGPGYEGAAWWPINMARLMEAAATNSFDQMREEVPPGLDDARNAVDATLIDVFSKYKCSSANLILGGFSQGAMLAMDVAARGMNDPPAKLALLSGACICESLWIASGTERLKQTESMQSHGRMDPVLPIQTGLFLNNVLQRVCAKTQLIEFDGFHQIPDEAIDGIALLASQIG